jgi:hypothetical protein
VTWTAYVDESEPSAGGTYILGCALVDVRDAETVRASMIAARNPGEKKVHWHDRLPAEQPALVELVASLSSMHLVVVRDDCAGERPDRRRMKCLERLLWLLDDRYGVAAAVLEARQAKQNANDLKLLQSMRAAKTVTGPLRLDHIAGPKEALLWIPDVVAGAFTAGRTGRAEVYAPLAGLVDVEHTPA